MDEKLYLLHEPCGEVFDDMKVAYEHMPKCDSSDYAWTIQTESEAF